MLIFIVLKILLLSLSISFVVLLLIAILGFFVDQKLKIIIEKIIANLFLLLFIQFVLITICALSLVHLL